jgi:mannose-6-phosphate isomerase-like protein (cupin superfamily)
MANEPRPSVFSVYDLEQVPNVCNQVLRETIKLPLVSMAHVTMNKGNVSLLHSHTKMREAYFILDGRGVLYRADEAIEVAKGAFLSIPAGTPHKLRNIGEGELEHLVFASPPFNPEDVSLINGAAEPKAIVKYSFNKRLFSAKDGAVVYELDSNQERTENGVAFAHGTLSPKRQALKHFHKISDEVYYVISGRGNVSLGNSVYPVSKGSVVFVPSSTVHGLENTDDEDLEVLCLSTPPYQNDDFLLV